MQPDRSFEESGKDEASRSGQGVAEESNDPDDFWAPKKRTEDLSPRDWASKAEPDEPEQKTEKAPEPKPPSAPPSRDDAVTEAQRRIQELLGTFSGTESATKTEPAPPSQGLSAAPPTTPATPTPVPESAQASPKIDTSTPKVEGPGPVKVDPQTTEEPASSDLPSKDSMLGATQAMPSAVPKPAIPPPTTTPSMTTPPITTPPVTSPPVSAPEPTYPPSQQRFTPYTKGRVRLLSQTIDKIHPWSVLKLSLLFYFSVMLVVTLAVMLLYYAAEAAGIISNLESFIQGIGWSDWTMGAGTVLRVVLLIGVINTVFWSAVNVLIAFLYNLVSEIVGGVRITTTEREL